MKRNLALVTSYPIGTGIYRVFQNYANLGIYDNLYYFKSINNNSLDISPKPMYREARPKSLPSKLAFALSFNFDSVWRKISSESDYIHVLEPGFFHLSKCNIPVVGTVHDLYPLENDTKNAYSFLYKLFYKKDMGYLDNLLGITTISKNTDRILKKFFPNVTSRTIHHWTPNHFIKLDKFNCRKRFSLPQSKFILLNVSFRSGNKNLDFLGAVIDSLTDDFLLIHLGNDKVFCKNNNRVKNITNFMDDNTLVRLYNAADIYLAPSTSEGFNFPVIEAINCGIPVIASDIPVFHEVLFDSPYILPLKSELWASKIISLTNRSCIKDAICWYKSNIGDYYRENRGRKDFVDFYESLGILKVG